MWAENGEGQLPKGILGCCSQKKREWYSWADTNERWPLKPCSRDNWLAMSRWSSSGDCRHILSWTQDLSALEAHASSPSFELAHQAMWLRDKARGLSTQTASMTLNRQFILCAPTSVFQLWSGVSDSAYFVGLLRGWNELIHAESLAEGPALLPQGRLTQTYYSPTSCSLLPSLFSPVSVRAAGGEIRSRPLERKHKGLPGLLACPSGTSVRKLWQHHAWEWKNYKGKETV